MSNHKVCYLCRGSLQNSRFPQPRPQGAFPGPFPAPPPKTGKSALWKRPGGGTLEISGWGCAAGTLEPLTYTRASSAEFCHPILE